jgi:crotonobetainyl-CoA:carnitine CoA-transferase CaiB-like acyl-CoA transferase
MQEAIYPVLTSNIASLHRNNWKQPIRRGNKHPTRGSAPYNVYPTNDGFIAIICVRESHWQNLLVVLGRADLKNDARFATQALRAKNDELVDGLVQEWTKTISKVNATAILKEYRVPAAPVRNLEEVTLDPHMHQRGMLKKIQHPIMGDVVLPTSPIKFHNSPEPNVVLEPSIGEHTDEVLKDWLGIRIDKIALLKTAGVVC